MLSLLKRECICEGPGQQAGANIQSSGASLFTPARSGGVETAETLLAGVKKTLRRRFRHSPPDGGSPDGPR